MKRLMAALFAVSIGGAVQAANPVSVDVWVQVQNLSIAVTTSTTFDYGIQQFAANQVQATKFTFQNNGNASEHFGFGVDGVNSTALTTGGGLWTLVTAVPGSEQVRLGFVMKSTAAINTDFLYAAPNDGLTTASQIAGGAAGTLFVADAASINPVAAGASHDGYTQIWLPSTTAQFTHVKIVVQATATP